MKTIASVIKRSCYFAIGAGMIGMCVFALSQIKPQNASADDGICRAVMVLDRSESVQDGNLVTMKNQIQRLFQAPSIEVNPKTGGLYTDKIQLAFWTFANLPVFTNYNAPYSGFVSSKGTNSTFNNDLASVYVQRGDIRAYTNYMEGMGYVGQIMNPNRGIQDIIKQADVIVFMTDGVPNQPGNGSIYAQGSARDAGRSAALRHLSAGRTLVGGFIRGRDGDPTNARREVNYLINGDYNNKKDTFDISSNYSDLAQQLKTQIGAKCNVVPHPCPTNEAIQDDDPACLPPSNPYSLKPKTTVNPSLAEGGANVSFGYSITNNTNTKVGTTSWSSIGIKAGSATSVDSIKNFSNGYQDSSAINQAAIQNDLIARLGGPSKATIISGTPSGEWSGDSLPSEDIVIPDNAQPGEKYCRLLLVKKPTADAVPTYRYSSAECVTIGVRPVVQISGGDLYVGRPFADSLIKPIKSNVQGNVSVIGNKTFGSQTEYGITASGTITNFASSSGLQGGAASSKQEDWSKLTFANTQPQGNFASSPAAIPDVARAVLGSYDQLTAPRVSGTAAFNPSSKGLFTANGDISLPAYQTVAGQIIVVYAPRNTVTITGDIKNTTAQLKNAREIPQVIIIADKITINGSVKQIDAWLVAKGANGFIDTCGNATQPTIAECNQRLTVNGPVMAQQLFLKRTAKAGPGEPSEEFNLRADSYIWANELGYNVRRLSTTYTQELPPRF